MKTRRFKKATMFLVLAVTPFLMAHSCSFDGPTRALLGAIDGFGYDDHFDHYDDDDFFFDVYYEEEFYEEDVYYEDDFGFFDPFFGF